MIERTMIVGERTLQDSKSNPPPPISSPEPTLGVDIPGSRYVGRLVAELWEPPDPTKSDGLHYAVFAQVRTKQQADAFSRQVLAKLSRRLTTPAT